MKLPKARKLPSGSWNIQLRLDGHSISITESTESECKHTAMLLKAQHEKGVLEAEARTLKPMQASASKEVTLRDVVRLYIDSKDNVLSPATLRSYDSVLKSRFKSVMDKPVNSIRNWQKVINSESALVSAKTVKNAWGLVHPALKLYGINVDNVTLPMTEKTEARFLDPYEVKRFIKLIEGNKEELICLLALHSLRRSEIMGLRKRDIYDNVIHVRGSVVMDRDGNYVRKSTNKTVDSKRNIPIMIPRLAQLIEDMPDGNLYKGNPINNYKRINKFCIDNGFEEMGHHGFRHSFVVLAFEAGLPVFTVQRLGGWKTPNTVNNIYNHLSERQRNEAFKKIGKLLESDD